MSENINNNNNNNNNNNGTNSEVTNETGVHVYCRVRPPNEAERTNGNGILCVSVKSEQCIEITTSSADLKGENDPKERTFYLDHIFPMDTTQSYVYKTAAKPIVDQLFKGINGTVLAYGQTSSGKTFTMEGVIGDNEKMGVIPRMVHDVFGMISNAEEHIEFQLKVSICEVYMERIRDLLDTSGTKNNLRIHEDKIHGIYVKDLSEYYVTSPEEVFELMALGHKHRAVASTNMNSYSSRSHLIFMLQLQQKNVFDSSVKVGRLFLVDLAGSEKISKTGAEGLTLDEAKTINKSLSCLGNVINALTDNSKNYIPYRDSKLTRILQNSLGGNSLTALIVTCSPSAVNEAETIGTLRFGIRAKMVKNIPKVNQQYSVEQLQILLSAAQKKLSERETYITLLESEIKQLGGEIPNFKEIDNNLDIESSNKDNDLNKFKLKSTNENDEIDPSSELDELGEAKQQLKQKSEEITQLQQKLSEISDMIKQITDDKENLNMKLNDITNELNQSKYQQQDQNEKIQQLQLTNKSLVNDLEQSHIQMQKLEQQIDSLKTCTISSNNEDLTNKLSSLDLDNVSNIKNNCILNLTSNNEHNSSLTQTLKDEISLLRQYLLSNCIGEDGEKERTVLLNAIDENITKIAHLENKLNENQKMIKKADVNDQDTKDMLQKMSQLDASMEHLSQLYQKLVEQNSTLKSQGKLYERRLRRKEERINQLEKSLIDAKAKYTKLISQCNSLTKTIENISKLRPIFARLAPPNIVRGIQGGGGKSSIKSSE
ncbi:kinesin motor domain-containing protein [Cryptosporidium serpentis]